MKQIDRSFIKAFSYSGLSELDREYIPTIIRVVPDEKKKAFISEIRGTIRHTEKIGRKTLSLIS